MYLFSTKKYFCYVRILSFKENMFIFNQNIFLIKNLYLHPSFFHRKNICLFNQKLMRSMKFFYSMIFGRNLVFHLLVKWRKVFAVFSFFLYSGFDAYVSHKNELHLTVSLLRFVFLLRKVKHIFIGRGFVLDCRMHLVETIKFLSR